MKNIEIFSKVMIKYCTFAVTVHTTLPTRTASQGVSFTLYTLPFQLNNTFYNV
jgi:hypothetical protein